MSRLQTLEHITGRVVLENVFQNVVNAAKLFRNVIRETSMRHARQESAHPPGLQSPDSRAHRASSDDPRSLPLPRGDGVFLKLQ